MDVLNFRNITCNHMLWLREPGRGKYDIFSLESVHKRRPVTERQGLPLIFPHRLARTITHSFTNT